VTEPLPPSLSSKSDHSVPPPALGAGIAGVLAVLGALGLLIVVDLLGQVAAGHAGAFGGVGLLAALPVSVGVWLSLPPMLLIGSTGLAVVAGLAAVVMACGHGVARGDVARFAGGLDLLAVLAAGVVWSPMVAAVIGAQAVFLALACWINRGRGPQGGSVVPGVTQATRILGVVAAIWLGSTTPPALAVSLVVVALAPWALVRLMFGRVVAPPVRSSAPAQAEVSEEAESVDEAETPTLEGGGAPDLAAGEPEDVWIRPVGLPTPSEVVDPAVVSVSEVPAAPSGAGPFGVDPLADTAHLAPGSRLIDSARDALESGGGAILAVIRVDGLAGIAEHLGETGGGALFAQTSERLAEALPETAHLAWVGDETFAALVPVVGESASGDMDSLLGSLGDGLAAPFAAEMVVEGRAISMEDAIHVEVTVLQAEMLPDLEHWVAATPGG